jgi:hypothetical protein
VAEREGLIRRIRQIRRVSADARERVRPSMNSPRQDEVRSLEARVWHLEKLVQGLQDSVHRESSRLSGRVVELEARLQPGAIARALNDDARERGL